MEDVLQLERLSVINRVVTELENNCGIGEPTLAEFVISIAEQNQTEVGFSKQLLECGADFEVCWFHKFLCVSVK